MKPKFAVNDFVKIKRYAGDEANERGRVTLVRDGLVHVSNMNMPFCGSVCDWFRPDELEKI